MNVKTVFPQRKPPPAPALQHPPQHAIDPDTTRILDSIVQSAKELDMVKTEKAALEVQVAELRRSEEFYRAKLEEMTRQRDLYMRHSTAMTQSLNAIEAVIHQAQEQARTAAVAPPPVPATPTEETIDEGIANIAARFGANNRNEG